MYATLYLGEKVKFLLLLLTLVSCSKVEFYCADKQEVVEILEIRYRETKVLLADKDQFLVDNHDYYGLKVGDFICREYKKKELE